MMYSEWEKITGWRLTADEYAEVEAIYMDDDHTEMLTKTEWCQHFLDNETKERIAYKRLMLLKDTLKEKEAAEKEMANLKTQLAQLHFIHENVVKERNEYQRQLSSANKDCNDFAIQNLEVYKRIELFKSAFNELMNFKVPI
jgi:hypothetical protein